MQDVVEPTPEFAKPAVLRPIRLAGFEQDCVVLIEGEEALPAPGGAEHDNGEGTRRPAAALADHSSFGELRRPTGEGSELPCNDAGDVPRAHVLLEKTTGGGRHLGPGAREGRHVLCLVDIVSKLDRRARPEAEEVAGGDGADDLATLGEGSEVSYAARAHAPDGPVDESLLRHANDRPGGDLADGHVERGGAVLPYGAQEIALRGDAGAAGGLAHEGG
jgi:hypothetical protein